MLIQVQIQNMQGQVDIFQDTYFQDTNLHIHLQVKMFHFEYINHDIHLDFLF